MGMVTSPVPLGYSQGQMRQGESGTVLDLWTLETKLLSLMVLLNQLELFSNCSDSKGVPRRVTQDTKREVLEDFCK